MKMHKMQKKAIFFSFCELVFHAERLELPDRPPKYRKGQRINWKLQQNFY